MNVAEYLANFLSAAGVARIYGLPGGENLPVIEALRQAGLEYILVHHEATAGFAADVTGQLTGIPGVCLATVGPGAMNLLSTAVSATLERSPVLAITADIDPAWRSRVTHMNAPLDRLFAAGAKASFRLSPQTIGDDLAAAWRLALTPPRGAVHLAISPEVANSPIEPALPSVEPAAGPTPSPGAAEEALVQLVKQARQPFLLAGLGVEVAGAQQALLSLAESWQTPVAVMPKAKGHFPETHPLFAGCLSAYGDQPLRRALGQADLIVGIGLDGVDLVTSVWDIDTPLISIAPAQADDPVFRPALSQDGDLVQILSALQAARAPELGGAGWAHQIRRDILDRLETAFPPTSGTVGLNHLIDSLRAALPADGVVTVDVGAFKLLFLQKWQTDYPQTLFVANGLSAMGYALPGAMAVALARKQLPVVAVLGDGALLMYAGELATIARVACPMVILVVVDKALSLIRLKQLRQGVEVHGTEFGSTDYRALAEAFGLDYRLIDQTAAARTTLEDALRADRPMLVEARIDKREYDHFR